MNQYPVWKNLLVLILVLLGAFIAAPNLFVEDPAVQVSERNAAEIDEALIGRVEAALAGSDISYRNVVVDEGRLLASFDDPEQQREAADALSESLGQGYVVALNSAPRTPGWMRKLGMRPMSLGLDLSGGVHFLLEVDMDAAVRQVLERYETDFKTTLREEKIRYSTIRREADGVAVVLRDTEDRDKAERVIRDLGDDIEIETRADAAGAAFVVKMTEQQIREKKDFAIQQNIITLKNRVNELGVAEPIVQRQGEARIVVQLPGVRDTAQAKDILGTTATLEFRMVDQENDPIQASRRGRPPLGSLLYTMRDDGSPILVKREIIVTGDQLTDATQGFANDDGSPAVFVRLDPKGARKMLETTKKNVGKRMAAVFIETLTTTVEVDGVEERKTEEKKEVINAAVIRGVFSKSFQITGLQAQEARNLALLLRAGALAAPVYIVEERTIGPSLGQDNIDKGLSATLIGFAAVVLFMILYYKGFGLIANLALVVNLVLIVALLSMLQAALTLPGIAGIVLTVGMAVDANVLIFERIREELNNANTPQASIHAGYEKAFSTIADANVTTLIAAVVLFAFGTGPIKGFAVTLSLGIITSMFTAIVGTRAVVNLVFGGRRLEKLPI